MPVAGKSSVPTPQVSPPLKGCLPTPQKKQYPQTEDLGTSFASEVVARNERAGCRSPSCTNYKLYYYTSSSLIIVCGFTPHLGSSPKARVSGWNGPDPGLHAGRGNTSARGKGRIPPLLVRNISPGDQGSPKGNGHIRSQVWGRLEHGRLADSG